MRRLVVELFIPATQHIILKIEHFTTHFGGQKIRPVFRKLVMHNFASSSQQGDAALLEFGSCMKCGESDFPSKIGRGLA